MENLIRIFSKIFYCSLIFWLNSTTLEVPQIGFIVILVRIRYDLRSKSVTITWISPVCKAEVYYLRYFCYFSFLFSWLFLDNHRRFYCCSFISMFYFHLVFGRLALSVEIISWKACKLNQTVVENQRSKEESCWFWQSTIYSALIRPVSHWSATQEIWLGPGSSQWPKSIDVLSSRRALFVETMTKDRASCEEGVLLLWASHPSGHEVPDFPLSSH